MVVAGILGLIVLLDLLLVAALVRFILGARVVRQERWGPGAGWLRRPELDAAGFASWELPDGRIYAARKGGAGSVVMSRREDQDVPRDLEAISKSLRPRQHETKPQTNVDTP